MYSFKLSSSYAFINKKYCLLILARLRQNHSRNKGNRAKGFLIRLVLFTILLISIILFIFFIGLEKLNEIDAETGSSAPSYERFYLPNADSNKVIHHTYYSLLFNSDYMIPEWVAYELTAKDLRVPNVERADRFERDPFLGNRSPGYYDYSGSGYTRGHMAPAGDFAFNRVAMEESFFMSNISPQKRKFNNGIWKELEEQIRDWAFHDSRLYIVTGPVINSIRSRISKSGIGIPGSFFKVVLDIDDPELKGIGFLIENDRSERRLQSYAMTIDEVERITGINFFDQLLEDDLEEKIESGMEIKKWKFSEKRYQARINKWNLQ